MTQAADAAIGTMAFYDPNGLVPSWTNAERFAGEGGRVATLPDIVDARIASPVGSTAWNTYFTTATSEFYGLSRGGVRVIAVAHGVGPLATRDGAVAAYSHEFKDKSRQRQGGRIDAATFHKLLDGHFGPVEAFDIEPILARYRYPFQVGLTPEEVLAEPLLVARLGGIERAARYVAIHAEAAMKERDERRAYYTYRDPEDQGAGRILAMKETYRASYTRVEDGPNGLYYASRAVEDGLALAHVLSIGQLVNMSCSGQGSLDHLQSEISVHDWTDGTRFVGVRAGARPGPIHRGIDVYRVKETHPELLWVPTGAQGVTEEGFHALVENGDRLATQYPKAGVAMDSGDAMMEVVHATAIGGPASFTVETAGHHAFFRYAIDDVQRHAPPGANAYLLLGSGVSGDARHQVGTVQFYRVKVDLSRRMLRAEDVYKDFHLMMRIAEAGARKAA